MRREGSTKGNRVECSSDGKEEPGAVRPLRRVCAVLIRRNAVPRDGKVHPGSRLRSWRENRPRCVDRFNPGRPGWCKNTWINLANSLGGPAAMEKVNGPLGPTSRCAQPSIRESTGLRNSYRKFFYNPRSNFVRVTILWKWLASWFSSSSMG